MCLYAFMKYPYRRSVNCCPWPMSDSRHANSFGESGHLAKQKPPGGCMLSSQRGSVPAGGMGLPVKPVQQGPEFPGYRNTQRIASVTG